MANVIALRPRRNRLFNTLVGGRPGKELVDDVLQDEIDSYQRSIENAKERIWRALDQVMIENELIDICRSHIAELEATRDQSVVVDFPALARVPR